jgi:hypothetical protein
MAVEGVVDPTRPVTDRRSPERFAENGADYAASDRADWPRDHKARTRPGRRADHVGAGTRRNAGGCNGDRDCKHRLTHGSPGDDLARAVWFHFVAKTRILAVTMMAVKSRKHALAFHVGFNPA